jgi:hypothetical protein
VSPVGGQNRAETLVSFANAADFDNDLAVAWLRQSPMRSSRGDRPVRLGLENS